MQTPRLLALSLALMLAGCTVAVNVPKDVVPQGSPGPQATKKPSAKPTAKPTADPTPEATATPTPEPTGPAVLSGKLVSPQAFTVTVVRKTTPTESSVNVAYQPDADTPALFTLSAPAGSPGVTVRAFEIYYSYHDGKSGRPQAAIPIAPLVVPAGGGASIEIPVVTRELTNLLAEDGTALDVTARIGFKDDLGQPVMGADLTPLVLTVPIRVQ